MIVSVTNAFAHEIKTWHLRPLEAIYPVVYIDCIHLKMRDDAHTVRVKTAYIAIGVNLAGKKDVLGLWIAQTEAANFRLQVINDLKHRGVRDILIACVDGLKGFPEAIETVYPQTAVQPCLVYLMRNSLKPFNLKRRKQVADDLKRIYQSASLVEAEQKLIEFKNQWNGAYPSIALGWQSYWNRVTSFFDYPPEIRRIICATRSIESVNLSLSKITRNHHSFPSDEALSKLLYLALMNVSKQWSLPLRGWKAALNRLSTLFEERLPNH